MLSTRCFVQQGYSRDWLFDEPKNLNETKRSACSRDPRDTLHHIGGKELWEVKFAARVGHILANRSANKAMRSGLKTWNRHARLQAWKNRQSTVQTHDFSTVDHFPLENHAGLAVTMEGNLVFGINEYLDIEIFDEETNTSVVFSKFRLLYDIYLQFQNCGNVIREHDEDDTPRVTQVPAQSFAQTTLNYASDIDLPDSYGSKQRFTVSGPGTSQHKRRSIRKYNKSEKEMQKISKFRRFKETHRTQHLHRRSDKQDLHFYDSTSVRPVGTVVEFSGVEEDDFFYHCDKWDAWSADDMLYMSWDDLIHM